MLLRCCTAMWLPGCSRSGRQCSLCQSTTGVNTTLSCSRSEPRCVGINQLNQWTGGVPCIVASCSDTTHSSSSSLAPPPFFLGDAHIGDSRCISTSQTRLSMSLRCWSAQRCGVCQSWSQGGRGGDGSGGQPAHKLKGDLVRDWHSVLVCVVCM